MGRIKKKKNEFVCIETVSGLFGFEWNDVGSIFVHDIVRSI